MKLLLELSMECEPLARAEAVAAATALGGEPKIVTRAAGVLVMETSADPSSLASRLALCHHVSEWLAECGPDELEQCAKTVDVPGPIRVRSTKVGERCVDLGSITRRVGAVLGRHRGVDLHAPASDVRVVFSDSFHVGRLAASIDRSGFEKRKNRYMPFVYPASLHPKYARALVNLTEVPTRKRLLDPFCGTGAILAEASLVGLKAMGSDFAERMVQGSRKNLRHLGLTSELHACDIGKIGDTFGHVDGIATDPPYGRSTSTSGERIPALYERSFESFASVLDKGGRVAMVVPDKKLLEKADDFELLDDHRLWVHRSLTRHFCVLAKN